MIVKIQQSIITNEKAPQVLVYNKSRTIEYQGDLPDDIASILNGRPKAYFEAKMNPVTDMLEIHNEVKPRNW